MKGLCLGHCRWRCHHQRAFTLVELLVVIGIIALLIAILLPALSRARQSAITATCLSNQRQLGQGLLTYSIANRGIVPYSYEASGGAVLPGMYWHWPLAQEKAYFSYVSGPHRRVGNADAPAQLGEYGGTAIKCPQNSLMFGLGAFNGVSYSIMRYTDADDGYFRVTYDTVSGERFAGCRIARQKPADEMILALDSATGTVGITGVMRLEATTNEVMPGVQVNPVGNGNRGGTLDRPWLCHPNNMLNVLFSDGHAETQGEGWVISRGIRYYFDNNGTAHQ